MSSDIPLQLSATVAALYAEHASAMATRVTEQVLRLRHTNDDLSAVPVELLDSNHRNHAAFMTEVFRSRNAVLLEQMLPWVYYTYHNQGVPYHYFVLELETWKDVITDTLGDAAPDLVRIYDALLAQHGHWIQEADAHRARRQATTEQAMQGQAEERLADFTRALSAADYLTLLEIGRDFLNAGGSYTDLLQRYFQPAMVEIGACWSDGALSVDEEHQATATANLALSILAIELPLAASQRGHAVVASVASEFHEVGAWMVATALELDGWDVTFLGRDVDTQRILDAVCEHQARLLALSVTMPAHIQAARDVCRSVRDLFPGDSRPRIMTGGQVFAVAPDLAASIGADTTLRSLEDATTWARTYGLS